MVTVLFGLLVGLVRCVCYKKESEFEKERDEQVASMRRAEREKVLRGEGEKRK